MFPCRLIDLWLAKNQKANELIKVIQEINNRLSDRATPETKRLLSMKRSIILTPKHLNLLGQRLNFYFVKSNPLFTSFLNAKESYLNILKFGWR